MKEIPKAFDSKTEELKISHIWEESGLSNPENMESHLKEGDLDIKESFTIPLPPPNANGDLHIGHMCG